MSDDRSELSEARSVLRRWPGLVWAIPLAALIIVAYLGIRAASKRGVVVTLVVKSADGVTPGDTKVMTNGVESGHVTKVHLAPDGRHVELKLSLDKRMEPILNTHTKFWLIGENPTITDIQSVRAAVAGVIVGVAPGYGGEPARRFVGLDYAPVIYPGTHGTTYYLTADQLGPVQSGASILYHGQEIGKIVATALRGFDRFRIEAFVYRPFDTMVRSGAQFWAGSPIKLSLSGSNVSAGLTNPASVLKGSVQFDLPKDARANPRSPAGTVFTLYDDQTSAQQGPPGPDVRYRIVLTGAAGDLDRGSDVKLLGYTVGSVESAKLAFTRAGAPYTVATIALHPHMLDVLLPESASAPAWRSATDAAVTRLVARGYRAALDQSPPLVGPHQIALVQARGARAETLGHADGGPPLIPTRDEQADIGGLLDKIDALPIGEIGENVRRLTGNLARLTGSPALGESIVRLDATLGEVDAMLKQVRPQIGPLVAKLNQTAEEVRGTAAAARGLVAGEGQAGNVPDTLRQLDLTARSIRTLTDYLGRHPEALIRGKAKETK